MIEKEKNKRFPHDMERYVKLFLDKCKEDKYRNYLFLCTILHDDVGGFSDYNLFTTLLDKVYVNMPSESVRSRIAETQESDERYREDTLMPVFFVEPNHENKKFLILDDGLNPEQYADIMEDIRTVGLEEIFYTREELPTLTDETS